MGVVRHSARPRTGSGYSWISTKPYLVHDSGSVGGEKFTKYHRLISRMA